MHLTTSSTVLGQARHRARENPWTDITGKILQTDGGNADEWSIRGPRPSATAGVSPEYGDDL
jgi:hypothetical protein